ncbi:hypothetical protein CRE_31622 [Caenorhabditis remanei]|uniref:Uncharacterized protein n=1 Tax=Caenorhabditis remanei TaxID=31234 RepID=E3NT69_CAERE|nr:hypothetical protein CRE_31622 [Caenorhabditis remanei]
MTKFRFPATCGSVAETDRIPISESTSTRENRGEKDPFDEEELRELFTALMREQPMRRIEPSNGKWKLSITETSCDPSFLWDRPEPKGKVSQATSCFVSKDNVNPSKQLHMLQWETRTG